MTLDLGSEDLKSQVFATIYETEGLAHHMAVERAHVSWKPQVEKTRIRRQRERSCAPTLCKFDSLFYLFFSEYLWKIGCWSWRRHNRRWIHTGVSFFFLEIKTRSVGDGPWTLGTLSQLLKADSELSVPQGCLMDEDLVRLLGDWTASWHQVLGKLVHVSVYIVRLHTGSVLCITDWLRHQTCGLQRTAVTLMSHMIMMW